MFVCVSDISIHKYQQGNHETVTCRLESRDYNRYTKGLKMIRIPKWLLTPNRRSVFRAGVSLNIHSFIHSKVAVQTIVSFFTRGTVVLHLNTLPPKRSISNRTLYSRHTECVKYQPLVQSEKVRMPSLKISL